MTRYAVCYVASAGYLFQTVLSASQARANVDVSVEVFVVVFTHGSEESREERVFRVICAEIGVQFLRADIALLGGLGVTYGRLFLDLILPPDVEELLYLDGDTQILGSIDPLVNADPPHDGAIAVRDPMVFIRDAVPSLRSKIDSDWDQAKIPQDIRARYINAGVLRIQRKSLSELRRRAMGFRDRFARPTAYADQDVINLALGDRLDTVSMDWNFPGFLLGSAASDGARPRIVHFMSNPRPWSAPLIPWGRQHYQPYVAFAEQYSDSIEYWNRATGATLARFVAQQLYKRVVEGPKWRGTQVVAALRKLSESERVLE